MSIFRRAIRKLRELKGVPVAPTKPSEAMQDEANAILNFAASKEWEAFQEYIEGRFGIAMDGVFRALHDNDERALLREAVRAEVYYNFLRDVDRAVSVNKKMSEVKI